jgi:probable phosphoglycerate mutase
MEEHHPPTWFGLLRHARTAWNEEKRIQGQNDISLTPEGRFQAREWGRHLIQYRWDRIITSDARRALETAGLVNISLRVPLVHDGCLREQNWGRWTGKTVAQLKEEVPQLVAEQERAGWKFCPPGGEDRNTVWERSQRALQGARGKWPGERILVVTHEGVIKCLIYRLCGRQFLPSEPSLIRSHHFHWLVYDREGLRLEGINAQALP